MRLLLGCARREDATRSARARVRLRRERDPVHASAPLPTPSVPDSGTALIRLLVLVSVSLPVKPGESAAGSAGSGATRPGKQATIPRQPHPIST